MRILHLAAGNRWTGAAAPAFAEVEALRAAGIDAHYAYVGGYKLEAKLGHHDFAHPLIEKAQNPLAFKRTLNALDRAIRHHGFDVLHAHLTYDHWLARIAARDFPRLRIARTFHARRVLRTDLFTASLVKRTPLLFVINEAFADAPALRGRHAVFTPPPVDHRQFSPHGEHARALYRFDRKVVTIIGKVAPGRGF
ncbi:MAG TPA: glycosyltransferase, partial [Thermoanaerobaculia bacterium]